MAVWTITGEAGKSWDATSKTLAERAVENASLTFRSVGTDELVMNIREIEIDNRRYRYSIERRASGIPKFTEYLASNGEWRTVRNIDRLHQIWEIADTRVS